MSGKTSASSKTKLYSWTLNEAADWLCTHPDDPIVQYIALQLAWRESRVEDIGSLLNARSSGPLLAARGRQINLLSIFSGAAAVHESLQLDAMRPTTQPSPVAPSMGVEGPWPPQRKARKGASVPIDSLKMPSVASHPFKEMLGDKKPSVSKLAAMVPGDNFLVESKSANSILQALQTITDWGEVFSQQGMRDVGSARVAESVRTQLLFDGEQFEDLLQTDFDEVAITGSDLYLAEGSDVTVLFLGGAESIASLQNGINDEAQRLGLECESFKHDQLECVRVQNADATVRMFATNLNPNLHIRSNSLAAMKRIATAAKHDTNLGATAEFAYIRTLIPWDKTSEDVFVYFSDPFVHRLISPGLRLTERRRMICYNHMRMIGHASLLHCTETGVCPTSLDDLVQSKCLSENFNNGVFTCPDGGAYSLMQQGKLPIGQCTHHGNPGFMTPCLEIPVSAATAQEVVEYETFVREYSQYWRTYFDPICMRMQMTNDRYELETIVLPLIDNSVYTTLADSLGGQPETLESAPMPSKTVLSTGFKLNKSNLLTSKWMQNSPSTSDARKKSPFLKTTIQRDTKQFISHGIGNQLGIHVWDSPPTFHLDLPALLAFATTNSAASQMLMNPLILPYVGLIASLNVPVYATFDVRNEEIVDNYLAQLEQAISKSHNGATECFKVQLGGNKIAYGLSISVGPAGFKFFWSRIDKTLYVTSQISLLKDIWKVCENHQLDICDGEGSNANALIRIRPERWAESLPSIRHNWKENNCRSCHRNLSSLTAVSKALASLQEHEAVRAGDLLHEMSLHPYLGVTRVCPDGGIYKFDADNGIVECNVHGSSTSKRLDCSNSADKCILPEEMNRVTAALKFLEDGLHAKLVLERGSKTCSKVDES